MLFIKIDTQFLSATYVESRLANTGAAPADDFVGDLHGEVKQFGDWLQMAVQSASDAWRKN